MKWIPMLLFGLVVAVSVAWDFESVERKHLRLSAEGFGRLCEWALSKGLKKEAEWAFEWAHKLGLKKGKLDRLKTRLCGVKKRKVDKRLFKEWESRSRNVCVDAARRLEKVFKAGRSVTDKEALKRLDRYLFWMLELDGVRRRWRYLLGEVKAALSVGGFERVVFLTERGLKLRPPSDIRRKLEDASDKAKSDRILLERLDSPPLAYYICLPKRWSRRKERKWPVLLVFEGAGSGFKGMAAAYRKARGHLPVIIVVPCTFSNTKSWDKHTRWYDKKTIEEATKSPLEWDEKAVLQLIKNLRDRYNAQPRVYITGFSGGGIPCYMMLFKHPDLLAGAAPVCANFYHDYTYLAGRFKPDDLNLPVHIITGGKDPFAEVIKRGAVIIPGINAQTENAIRQLRSLGYPNIKQTCYPEMGHKAACDKVIETFKPYIMGQKKRGDRLD